MAPLKPGTDTDAVRRRLETFAKWSDDVVSVPGTKYRIGLEPLVGLIPGVGDGAGVIVAAYVPFEAWRVGAPWPLIGRLWKRIGIDAVAGLIPVLGDAADFAYKANRRNVNDVLDWLDAQEVGKRGDERRGTRER